MTLLTRTLLMPFKSMVVMALTASIQFRVLSFSFFRSFWTEKATKFSRKVNAWRQNFPDLRGNCSNSKAHHRSWTPPAQYVSETLLGQGHNFYKKSKFLKIKTKFCWPHLKDCHCMLLYSIVSRFCFVSELETERKALIGWSKTSLWLEGKCTPWNQNTLEKCLSYSLLAV